MIIVALRWCIAILAVIGASAGPLPAQVDITDIIDFEDLTSRSMFNQLGIQNTYRGYVWSAANPAFDAPTNWASATVSAPAVDPAPTPVSGSSYAWGWAGPQSLFIDFLGARNFLGGYFAILSTAFGSNASSVQFFGYDAGGAQIASSGTLALTASYQYLEANFTGIHRLELRADRPSWYAIDDLTFGTVTTESHVAPEPVSIVLLGSGLVGIGAAARRRRRLPDGKQAA